MNPIPDRPLVCGLVSISDRASQGVYTDQGLPELENWLRKTVIGEITFFKHLIADDQATIEQTLIHLADEQQCDLILTTGGTGPARRDITPEATKAVGTKEMPGFGEQMRQISLHFVPTALLSRQTAVIREHPSTPHACLILNLPGQPKAITETLEGVKNTNQETVVPGIFAAVPYCLQLINGVYIETRPEFCKSFRPKNAMRSTVTQ